MSAWGLSAAGESRATGTTDVSIKSWSFNARGLGLRPGSCMAILLSRIWDVTHNGIGVFRQTQAAFAREFGFDRKTVRSAAKELSDKGLILRAGTYTLHGHEVSMWVINDRACDKARADVMGGLETSCLEATSAEDAVSQGKAAALEEARAVESVEVDEKAMEQPPASPEEEGGDDVDASFDDFKAAYPRPDRNAKALERSRGQWRRIMSAGHTPEELRRALSWYIEMHNRRNPGAMPQTPEWLRYFKFMASWLSDDAPENWKWALEQSRAAVEDPPRAAGAQGGGGFVPTPPARPGGGEEPTAASGKGTEMEQGDPIEEAADAAMATARMSKVKNLGERYWVAYVKVGRGPAPVDFSLHAIGDADEEAARRSLRAQVVEWLRRDQARRARG